MAPRRRVGPARPTPANPPSKRPAARERDRLIFLTAAPIGLLLLVLGQVGARTGVMLFSFDQHHLITQLVGALLLLWGLTRWH